MHKPKTYPSRFVFSMQPVVADLENDIEQLVADAGGSDTLDPEVVLAAWTMTQLERQLYLNLEVNEQRSAVLASSTLIPQQFLHSHPATSRLLAMQIRPLLTVHHALAYTERLCRAKVSRYGLELHFL